MADDNRVHYLAFADLWHESGGETTCGIQLVRCDDDTWRKTGTTTVVPVTPFEPEITCPRCRAKCHLPRKD